MKLQYKMNEIASVFGASIGTKAHRRCSGKWRGTVDYSIEFDNGESYFVGNSSSRKKFEQLVDETYSLYNPLTVHATKKYALGQLKLRAAQDNAIAEKMGVLSYEVVSVEMITTGSHLGWYYAVLEIGNEIVSHLETGLFCDIQKQKFDESIGVRYYTAGAVKDEEVDYIFNGVGFSSKSTIYKPRNDMMFHKTLYTEVA
jgi:hypothetical protein